MPEFILNESGGSRGRPDRFDSLNEFAKGYVEAMLFTNADSGDEVREDHANELGVGRLTRSAIASIREDCAAFERDAAELLAQAYERPDYSPEQAGRDFWFTRQGHGVGFWDRKQLEALAPEWQKRPRIGERSAIQEAELSRLKAESLGTLLTAKAKAAGEAYPQIFNGWIHYS